MASKQVLNTQILRMEATIRTLLGERNALRMANRILGDHLRRMANRNARLTRSVAHYRKKRRIVRLWRWLAGVGGAGGSVN